MYSSDIGPGNCLIDKWIKINLNKNYDEDGKIAESGKINKTILKQVQKLQLQFQRKFNFT